MRGRWNYGGLLLALLWAGCAESTVLPHDGTDAPDVLDQPEAEDVAEAEAEVPGCRPGQSDCGGRCVDLTTDPANCGRCGRACAAGEVCNEGTCSSTCSAGLANCAGACVELATDPEHCGDCATACARNENCTGGDCVCEPACDGRECGDDGCGGSCGSCPDGTVCSSAGRCLCEPACDGRECGDDGCGGSCGACGDGFVCGPDGRCTCPGTACGAACCGTTEVCLSGACCEPTWRVETSAALSALARDDDGTLYVAGKDGTQAYVAAYDACGARLREQRFTQPAAATATALSAIALAGTEVYVAGQALLAGTDPGNGMWARLPKATLTPTWGAGLWGGDHLDEIWSVGVTTAGDGWMFGTISTDFPPTTSWVVRGYADTGRACGFGMFPSATGSVGRGLLLTGGRVYLAGVREGRGVVTSFADTECGFTAGPCPCTPSGDVVTMEVAGAAHTEVRGLAAAGGVVYGAGFADIGGDLGALVAGSAGTTVTFAPRWNPTAQIDAFNDLAADPGGGVLYAVGTQGWPGAGETGQGVVARYAVPGLAAEWRALPTGTWACLDVVVDAAGGVVTSCSAPGSRSVLARCLASGACP
jgi:hypothetical protein